MDEHVASLTGIYRDLLERAGRAEAPAPVLVTASLRAAAWAGERRLVLVGDLPGLEPGGVEGTATSGTQPVELAGRCLAPMGDGRVVILNVPAGEAPSLELRSNGGAISLHADVAGGRAGEPRGTSATGPVVGPAAPRRPGRFLARQGPARDSRGASPSAASAGDRARRAAGGRRSTGSWHSTTERSGSRDGPGTRTARSPPSPSSPRMARRWSSRTRSGSEGPTSRSSSARPGRTTSTALRRCSSFRLRADWRTGGSSSGQTRRAGASRRRSRRPTTARERAQELLLERFTQ